MEEKSLVCILNGCEPCKLIRMICQTLKHDIKTQNALPRQVHCRWCGKALVVVNPFKIRIQQ